MNISTLETFYWVATLKSSSEAAKRLRVSQPTVSMRMAALQRELGTDLYRGTGKLFQLTNAGRRIFAKCEAIVVLSKELEDQVREAATAATTGYVGVTDVVALSWLPEFLVRLREYPTLNVGIKTGTLNELMTLVQSGEIDAAFVLEPINDPGLASNPICEFTVKWVGAPELLPAKKALDITDLIRLPIIRSPRNSYRYEKLLEYFRWHDVPGVEAFQPRWLDVGLSMSTCAHLASRGVGVTAIPVAAVPHLLDDGRLSIINVPQEFLPWKIAAVRKRAANPAIIDPVIESAKRAAKAFERTSENSLFFRAVQD